MCTRVYISTVVEEFRKKYKNNFIENACLEYNVVWNVNLDDIDLRIKEIRGNCNVLL